MMSKIHLPELSVVIEENIQKLKSKFYVENTGIILLQEVSVGLLFCDVLLLWMSQRRL